MDVSILLCRIALLWSACALLVDARVGQNLTSSKPGIADYSYLQAANQGYTDNGLCRQHNCINPIFPGLTDLPRLETLTWQCSTRADTSKWMNFCKEVVPYDHALPNPIGGSKPVSELVKAQDDAAETMYYYHLNGMGYDGWDYRTPATSDNDCVRSVWKMVCFTYFPRANAGCKKGEVSLYQRPCKNSCQNYVKHCGVECCDESVQCVFRSQSMVIDGGTGANLNEVETGYVDQEGPSAYCTGSGMRSAKSPFVLILALLGFQFALGASSETEQSSRASSSQRKSMLRHVLVMMIVAGLALGLQGCGETKVDGPPTHQTGNWRKKPRYLDEYRFLPPGAHAFQGFLNSCSDATLPVTKKCNGRGYCKRFNPNVITGLAPGVSFCMCDPEWADPECNTKRKSQLKAYLYSLFLGMLGADYFYLGYPLWGFAKLLSFGGLGMWWLTDIVRVASGPVYAKDFRVANDLSHAWAMLFIVFLCMVLGFLAAIESYMVYRTQKRLHIGMLEHEEEESHWNKTRQHMMQTYGATPFADPAVLAMNQEVSQKAHHYANIYHNSASPAAEMTDPADAEHGHAAEAGHGHGETGHAEHA